MEGHNAKLAADKIGGETVRQTGSEETTSVGGATIGIDKRAAYEIQNGNAVQMKQRLISRSVKTHCGCRQKEIGPHIVHSRSPVGQIGWKEIGCTREHQYGLGYGMRVV